MTGQDLKARLIKAGKSQKDIADILGVTAQSLSSVLSAKDVRSGTIEKIAKALGVSISYLYGEADKVQNVAATGNGCVAVAGNNNVTSNTGDAAILQERIAMMEKLLDEKERLINVLMNK